MAQFPAHHAGAGDHPGDLGNVRTEFGQRQIGLAFDGGTDQRGAGVERPLGTMPVGTGSALARLTPAAQPFLHGRQAHLKLFGEGGLGLFAPAGLGQDTFSQILRIRFHAFKCSQFLP